MTEVDITYLERYRALVDDWEAFLAAVKRPLPITLWVNPLKTTPARLAQFLDQPLTPLTWHPGAFRLPGAIQPGLHWSYLAGLFHLQEEVSMLPVQLLDPQPGARILDLCAAPGNKTAQLAIAAGIGGTVVANDRSAGRMRAARQNLDRLGLLNVTTTTYDGGNFGKRAGKFDYVLVDVPCTCEGTCRKDPHALRKASLRSSLRLQGPQQALLRKAVQLIRPGGRIVYATCTFAPEENELVVDAILREAGPEGVRLVPVTLPGLITSPGILHWEGLRLHESLRHAVRVWPHQNDSGGFFVAVLEKQRVGKGPDQVAFPIEELTLEREPWQTMLIDRYGFPLDLFAPYLLFRWSRKRLYLVPAGHQPPVHPPPDSIGLHFMNVDGRYPKLTTAAAMIFGSAARQNVVELEPEQLTNYVKRQDFGMTGTQVAGCSGTGYVLLRYQGFPLGVGVYRQHLGLVESMYPKGWRRDKVIV